MNTNDAPEIPIKDLLKIRGKNKLHIGGKESKKGWKILNAIKSPNVDYLGDVRDLSQFNNNEFDIIYASHIMEHLGYQRDLPNVLNNLYRILKKGGKLFIGVPDLDTLCRLFVHDQSGPEEQYEIMRMMFGGQTDEYDFHFVGLNAVFLHHFLNDAGFNDVYRVPEFNIFNDTSSLRFGGILISLNVIAIK